MKKILFIFIFFCLSLYSYSQDIIPTKVEWEVTSTEVQVSIHLNIPPKVHVYASEEQFFGIEEIEVLGLGETIQIFPATTQFEDIDGSMVETYENQVVFILKKAFQGKIGTEWKWNGVFSFQGCDNVSCYAPKDLEFSHQGIIPNPEENIVTTEIQKNKIQEHESSSLEMLLQKFSIQNTGFGYMSSDDFLNFLENKKETDSFSGKSIWLILLLILLGGLALNLTPCVLPMIPVNLAIMGAGVKASSAKIGYFLGFVYGLGLSLAYGALGLIVVFTGSQFGSLQSSPIFNFVIAVFFVILSLSMFDIIYIDFSKFRSGNSYKKFGQITTAFMMGIVTALLAGACVAPVVLSVLIYASQLYATGSHLALFLPFLLGIGMALPWPFLGASIQLFPKPGAWMNKIKYGFGILIFLLACYYGYLGYTLIPSKTTLPSSTHQNIEMALQESLTQKKPIFIDFWATWCKNCLAMDTTTFQNPKVQKQLEQYIFLKYQAENFQDKETKKVVETFQKFLQLPTFGLPTYVILEPIAE